MILNVLFMCCIAVALPPVKDTSSEYREFYDHIKTVFDECSLGFYVTGDAFYGKHDYSLNLDGIDTSFMDNAHVRGLIVHGAWYVSEEMKKKYGRMGKSWGCPAVPLDEAGAIIDAIKIIPHNIIILSFYFRAKVRMT
jgi:hypothetical protein